MHAEPKVWGYSAKVFNVVVPLFLFFLTDHFSEPKFGGIFPPNQATNRLVAIIFVAVIQHS